MLSLGVKYQYLRRSMMHESVGKNYRVLTEDKHRIYELETELDVAKKIIQDMLRDIPNRMWYTDATIKEAEEFLKEDCS